MEWGRRYALAMRAAVRRLPFGLSRVVAPTFLGFALINSSTFALDVALLWAMHGLLGWPLPVAVTLAYAAALTVSYALNRVLNFRSRAPVGRQFARYVAVVVVNYAACVLGVTAALTAAGADYRLARVGAGLAEACLMYLALRLLVFRAPGPSSRRRHGADGVPARR